MKKETRTEKLTREKLWLDGKLLRMTVPQRKKNDEFHPRRRLEEKIIKFH